MSQTVAPSPELFFQTLNSYQRTAALKTALELDVFSAIHEGAQTAPAAFAMLMLAGTESGDAYTMAELTSMLEASGFRDVARHDLPGPETVIVATR
jgi:hypothetical protein